MDNIAWWFYVPECESALFGKNPIVCGVVFPEILILGGVSYLEPVTELVKKD